MSIDEKQLLYYALNYLSIEGVRLVKLDKNTLHILVPKYHYMYNSEYTMYNIYNHKDFVDKIVKDVIHNVYGLKHLVINYILKKLKKVS